MLRLSEKRSPFFETYWKKTHQNKLTFYYQSRSFSADELYEVMLKSTGSIISSAFFELENRAIDEVIYLVELSAKISKESQPKEDNVIPNDLEYE